MITSKEQIKVFKTSAEKSLEILIVLFSEMAILSFIKGLPKKQEKRLFLLYLTKQCLRIETKKSLSFVSLDRWLVCCVSITLITLNISCLED